MKFKHTKLMVIVAVASTLILSACGGGGSDSTSSLPSLSGTAAGGAAVIGSLTVKDSTGQIRVVTIDTNGHYSVDVSGMTEPFVLKAVGAAGNVGVTYYSAAVAADVNGTVNVTPFTDLMVSNIVGQLADLYFATHNPSSALITASTLAAAQAALHKKLTPVLTAMGLSTSVDLLHSPFAADHTGLDAVMDVIKVDNATSTVNIVNSLNHSIIAQDDVTTGTDDGTAAVIPVADSSALAVAKSDLQQILVGMDAFQALFATVAPSQTQLTNSGLFDTTSFLNGGVNFSNWSYKMSKDIVMVGFRFSNAAITFDSPTTAWLTAKILMKRGHTEKFLARMTKSGGVWMNQGDQLIAGLSIIPRAEQSLYGNLQSQISLVTGLRIEMTRSQGAAATALLTGPGLPNGGVTMSGSGMIPECLNGSTFYCVNIANTVDNGKYNVVWKDSNGNILNGSGYAEYLSNRPVATSSLTVEMFPALKSTTIDAIPFTSLSQVVANARFATTMSLPKGYRAESIGKIISGDGVYSKVSSLETIFSSSMSYSSLIYSAVPTTVTSFSVGLLSEDLLHREFLTSYDYK